MDCVKARDGLWPPERPRLADAEALAAREHVASCRACQAYFAQDRALLEVYQRMRDAPAPESVRERVFDALARERTADATEQARAKRARRERAATLAVAALLLAVVVGTFGWLRQSDRIDPAGPEPVGMFAEDWLRRAVAEDRIASADPVEIRDFLARELGIAHTPPAMAGLTLVAAEICLLDGRRGAMITYRDGGRTLSHYVLPSPGAPRRPPAVERVPTDLGGPAIVTWATASLEHALVGHLPGDSLLALAVRH